MRRKTRVAIPRITGRKLLLDKRHSHALDHRHRADAKNFQVRQFRGCRVSEAVTWMCRKETSGQKQCMDRRGER